jgi:hypothetical protein
MALTVVYKTTAYAIKDTILPYLIYPAMHFHFAFAIFSPFRPDTLHFYFPFQYHYPLSYQSIYC